jgi:hypothetical protein
MEIVKVTGASGSTLTVVRAQEGTADVSHGAADAAALLVTAAMLNQYYSYQTVAKTSNFTADGGANVYLVNASGGAVTATLPAAASSAGKCYIFKKTDAVNDVTISGNDIDGQPTRILSIQYEALTVLGDGAVWHIL